MNPHLLTWALSTPWAMRPEAMAAYAVVLASHYAGSKALAAALAQHEPQAGAEAKAAELPGGARPAGNVAVIPVMGPIVEWPHQVDLCEGGTSTRSISRALAAVEADDTIAGAVMVFATPGGSVYGVAEAGDAINRVKAKKPVYGVAQSLAASAGYWLLSQCTEAYCSPGGEVGSIGVYSGHEDISRALEMAGVRIELFSAGKYKVEGHPFGPMSEEGKAFAHKRAMDYYGDFTRAVAKGRGVAVETVRNGMGEGRVLGAKDALAEKMIDGIATMDEVIAKMQRQSRAQPARRAALANAQAQLAVLRAGA